MRIVVDFGLCEAHGQCMEVAPDLFDVDDIVHVLIDSPDADRREAAEAAALSCPRQAIRIED